MFGFALISSGRSVVAIYYCVIYPSRTVFTLNPIRWIGTFERLGRGMFFVQLHFHHQLIRFLHEIIHFAAITVFFA